MFIPLPELSPFASQRDIDLYFFQQEQFEDQQKWRKQLISELFFTGQSLCLRRSFLVG